MTKAIPRNPRPWASWNVSADLNALPRMLSADEQRYLTWLTETKYEGWGAVVDLGCWLGSSSACLAEGMRRSGKPGKVQSFDLFVWDASYMARDAKLDLRDGDDFMPEFLRLTHPWADRISAKKQDLFDFHWNGGPVEILFVDAAKTWGLTNAIFQSFGPSIVPGKTRVVFQDFRYPQTMWLPLLTGTRPDLWEEIENTADGYTSTWRTRRALQGPGGIDPAYGPASFDFASASRVLAERERIDPSGSPYYPQTMLRAALMYGSEDDVMSARARAEALQCADHDRTPTWILEDIASDLVPLAWDALANNDAPRAIVIAQRCLRSRCPAPFALGPLALALSRLGRHDEALQHATVMRAQLPQRREPCIYLADIESSRGHGREALELLRLVIDGMGDDVTDADYVFALLERVSEQPGLAAAARDVASSASAKVLALDAVRVRIARIRARSN
jgi:hypothetical protein